MEKRKDRIMDDLISRVELIATLHKYFAEGFNEDRWWNSTHVLSIINEVTPSAQQWHTGEPSESGDYICYVKYNMTDGGSHEWIEHGYEVCAYYETDGSFEGDYAGWQSYGIVLAWMPLPEAPEVKHE